MDIEKKIKNPVCIRLCDTKNVILVDEVNIHSNHLVKGVMFGGNYYGFILIINTEKWQKDVYYSIQNRVSAIGYVADELRDFKVLKNKKYLPWLFSYMSKFKQEASNNSYSRWRKVFLEYVYEFNMKVSVKCFL